MPEGAISHNYPGKELETFARARNWKAYFTAKLRPYVSGRVLEVGAGIGSVTVKLVALPHSEWLAIEPDAQLFRSLETRLRVGELPKSVSIRNAGLSELPNSESFDTIVYIDVLEHIEDDCGELERAAAHLAPGGLLIVLAPAYQSLYAPFDAAVGHHRRYTLATLAALTPPQLEMFRGFYLDCIGVIASAANRFLLKRGDPTQAQIGIWDRLMIPCSRWFDRLFFYRFGRSVIAVWRRGRS